MRRFLIKTKEADIDAYIAHLDKQSIADGHKIPETRDMFVSGKRVTAVDWQNVLAQHRVRKIKHPDKKEWTIILDEFAKDHEGHTDTANAHKLDYTGAVEKLPGDWSPTAAVGAVIL